MITDEQINKMTLAEYLAALANLDKEWLAANPGGFVCSLTQDLNHWQGYGITTAKGLADYLDGCFKREEEKSRFDY